MKKSVKEQFLEDLTNKVLTAFEDTLNSVDDDCDLDPAEQWDQCIEVVKKGLKSIVDKLFSSIDQAILANEKKWSDKFGPVFSKTPERPELMSCSDAHALLNLKCKDLMMDLGTPIGQAYTVGEAGGDHV